MHKRDKDSQIEPIIEPILNALSISIVELVSRPTKDAFHVRLIIFKPEGISLEDCTQVHKAVFPRLEIELGRRDINIEVSSPGLGRNIKTSDEFPLFTGRNVKVLLQDEREWKTGTIGKASDSGFSLDQDGQNININYTDVVKARLDYTGG